MKTRVLVTGAGGFIGHHLVSFLVEKGFWVRGADIKYPEYQETKSHEFLRLDLRESTNCVEATKGIDQVFHLAADMGGIGYISSNHAAVARNNSIMNIHMLDASLVNKVKRFLFSSTACVYPLYRQASENADALKEEDAYPADPEEGYGWEKLYMEKLCEYYSKEHGIETRIVRFHNVFGPLGTYEGGREKVPAAICRKVALAGADDVIDVWGDGKQTRSFIYVEDCVEGILRIMNSDFSKPLNLGTDELISINELVDLVAKIAGKRIGKDHDLAKPQGVRGRNCDTTLFKRVLNWAPQISLQHGLEKTYRWIEDDILKRADVQVMEVSAPVD